MRRFIDEVKNVQRKLNSEGYRCTNINGDRFFGEIRFVFNDGKLVHFSSTEEGDGLEIKSTYKLP